MKMIDIPARNWRKSSYSADASNCVEVGQPVFDALHVRDSKDCDSIHLFVDSAKWQKFTDRIKKA
jgi:hypothetical protein